MRRITTIAVLGFTVLGVLLWLTQSFITAWEPQLRTRLERKIGEAAGGRVHIDALTPSWLHPIVLHNIEIWDARSSPPSLIARARRVSVGVSLVDLPGALLRKSAIDAIGRIKIDDPWVVLPPDFFRSLNARAAQRHRPLLFMLAWSRGTFQWKDPAAPHGAWTLYNSQGRFNLRGPSMQMYARGSLEQARSVEFRFWEFARRWRASANVADGDAPGTLALVERFAPRPVVPSGWSVQGRYTIEIHGAGRLPLRKTLEIRHASLTTPDLSVTVSSQTPPIHISGGVILDGQEMTFQRLVLKAQKSVFKVSGRAWPIAATPRLDLRASSPKADVSLLSAYIKPSTAFLPPMRGNGDVTIQVNGAAQHPDLTLSGKIPQGEVWNWPFQQAVFHIRRTQDRWEVDSSAMKIAQGTLSLNGASSPEGLNLQLNGDQIILPETGRLNLSASLHGPPESCIATGSFGLDNLAFGQPPADSLLGNFEITPTRFSLQAASRDKRAGLAAHGRRMGQSIVIDDLQGRLKDGATIAARGAIGARARSSDRQIRLAIDAKNVVLPEDVPGLRHLFPLLHGPVDLRGHLDGTLSDPMFTAEAAGRNLSAGSQPIAQASASLRWSKEEFSAPAFELQPGYKGSWRTRRDVPSRWDLKLALDKAPAGLLAAFLGHDQAASGDLTGALEAHRAKKMRGSGSIQLANGRFAGCALSEAAMRYRLEDNRLDVQQVTWKSPLSQAALHAVASWPMMPEGRLAGKVVFEGGGMLHSPDNGDFWTVPLRLKGRFNPSDASSGELELSAPRVVLRGQNTEPLEGRVAWDAKALRWEAARWGKQWESEGALRWAGSPSPPAAAATEGVRARGPVLSGYVKASDVSLAQWQTWLWPATKEPIHGKLSGTLRLGGSLEEPRMQLAANIDGGHWRSFHFTSLVSGAGGLSGVNPMDISGAFAGGGRYHYLGSVSFPGKTANGRLIVEKFNLRPLGDSLSFPQPLEGVANGTFTVSGALKELHFAGHLEGASLAYGAPGKNPFKLSSCAMDIDLQPDPKEPLATRLSVLRAVAKTQEEEIRLNPGSYVDFAGHGPARLRISSEIRNLHLGVFTLFGGLDVEGSWQAKPDGIALTGDANTRSLYINDYQLEQGRLSVSYYKGVVSFAPPRDKAPLITGTLDFHAMPQLKFADFYITSDKKQSLRLDGELGPSHWDFSLEGLELDLGTLGGLAGFPYPLAGAANGRVRGRGDLERPQVEGTLEVHHGQVAGLGFQSGSAVFLWQGDRMTFTRLELSDPGRYTLTGAGVFPLSAKAHPARQSRAIDFSVRLADSNLGLLESWSSEVEQAKGPVQALIQIKGTAEAPVLFGSIRVSHGDILGAHYFRRLKDFRLAADFDGNDLTISQFHGRSGAGVFDGGGHILFANLEPKFYNLRLNVTSRKGLDVQAPELAIPESPLAKKLRFLTTASRADVTGHVSFRGPAEAPVFSGEAFLANGHFTFPPPVKKPPPPGFVDWVRRINWDTTLNFGDGAWFENELVEASLAGSLRLTGPSDRLKVDGGMDISEGKISYLSLNFDIQEARFDVRSQVTDSGVVNTPYVRGAAESRVQALDQATGQNVDDTIRLTIDYAAVDQIKPRLASANDPALSPEKVLARATGLETQNLSPQERTTLYQQQMVRLIDTSLATPLARNILKRTGLIDELRVSHFVSNAGLTPTGLAPSEATAVAAAAQQQSAANLLAGTKYTLEKNISSRLSLGYGLRFEQITNPDLTNKLDLQSDVELAYRLMSNIYLRGSFDLPNTTPGFYPENRVTIEPRWRFSWWGNTNPPKPPRSGEPRPASGGPKRQSSVVTSSATTPSH